MNKIIRLVDRTRITTGWDCARARFYLTEFGQKGIVRATNATELNFGTDMHDALAELAKRLGEVDVVGDIAPRLYRKVVDRETDLQGEERAIQLASIAEGSFRGFVKVVWDQILRDYDIVSAEVECLKTITSWLSFMARPDLILRSKHDGTFWYLEYKTTSWADERWLKPWTKAIQTHSGCMAAEETLGIELAGTIVQGLYKGYKKDDAYRSVFSEGWRYLLGPEITYSYTYMRNKGWEKFRPIEVDGGISAWVENMPRDLLIEQYPRTAPIYIRRDMCEKFFSQLEYREGEIKRAKEDIIAFTEDSFVTDGQGIAANIAAVLDDVFPQNFSKCTPGFGHDCPYLEACWTPRVGEDPIGSGIYVERTPHHVPELEQLEANREQKA